jgi:hypothetical protein
MRRTRRRAEPTTSKRTFTTRHGMAQRRHADDGLRWRKASQPRFIDQKARARNDLELYT